LGYRWRGRRWDCKNRAIVDGIGRGGGHHFQRVWGRIPLLKQLVGQVNYCFGGGTEGRWGFSPPHRQDNGEGNKRFLAGCRWKGDAKGRYILSAYCEPVKAIRDVDLEKVDGSMGRIGIMDFSKEAIQGSAKLHRLLGCQLDGLFVHAVKGVVHDSARATVALRYNTQGGNAKVGQVFDGVVGKKDPITFMHEVEHFFLLKAEVVGG
jgi:hypothetical protein